MFKKKTLIIGLIIIITFIILLFYIPIHTLDLKSFPDKEIVFSQRVLPGDEYTLKYTHSVALTPVWEMFRINKKYQIILFETDFLDSGAGLPYAAFGKEIFVIEDNKFKIKNMNRIIYTPFYYRIGAIREDIFYFKGEEINLSSLVGDRLLTLEIDRNNLFHYLVGGNS